VRGVLTAQAESSRVAATTPGDLEGTADSLDEGYRTGEGSLTVLRSYFFHRRYRLA